MLVESSWWDGYDDSELNPGTISSVKFNDNAGRFFLLELDDEPGAHYPMRYDAVLKYADETHRSFHTFHLPFGLLPDPNDECVTLAQLANCLPTSRPSSRPTILHNSTTDEYSAQDLSDNESFGDANDGDWDESNNDAPLDDTLLDEESIEFEAGGDDDASDSSSSAGQPNHTTQDGNQTKYKSTDSEHWDKIGSVVKVNGQNITITPREIQPVPYVRENELFTPNLTLQQIDELKDSSGDIRFEKVFDYCLPRFGDETYFQFIAARMRNYMLHLIRHKGYKPKYYNPLVDRKIEEHHVARFYGVHMARMLRGFPSIEETWSSRESIDHIAPAAESMPKDAYIDMYRCMHFSDDWEVDENGEEAYWEDIHEDPRYEPSPEVERHRRKYEHIEDGYNRRWKEIVNFGRLITADESRVAG
eukprot:scaffold263758_cov139-Cyclotella_meneghiniana.AAC.1